MHARSFIPHLWLIQVFLTDIMYRLIEGNRKGSTIYVHENYEYRKNRTGDNGNTFLICTKTCPGRAVLKADNSFIRTKEHDHPSLPDIHFAASEGKCYHCLLGFITCNIMGTVLGRVDSVSVYCDWVGFQPVLRLLNRQTNKQTNKQ